MDKQFDRPYPYDAKDGREELSYPASRIIRSGSWNEGAHDLQVFYRSWIGPVLSESELGSRCAEDETLYKCSSGFILIEIVMEVCREGPPFVI